MRDRNTDSHNSVSTTPSKELQSHCSTTDVLLPASRAFKKTCEKPSRRWSQNPLRVPPLTRRSSEYYSQYLSSDDKGE